MPVFKGNLHAHTTFSDGRRPIDEVIARYRDLGYDFLAITDHDDRIDEDYWFNIPPGDDRMLVLARGRDRLPAALAARGEGDRAIGRRSTS